MLPCCFVTGLILAVIGSIVVRVRRRLGNLPPDEVNWEPPRRTVE